MKKSIITSLLFLCVMICGTASAVAADPINIDYSVYQEDITCLEEGISELEELFSECEKEQIPTAYEKISYNVLVRFTTYLKEELNNGIAYRTEENGYTDVIVKGIYDYNVSRLKLIYSECKESLSAYLAGTKYPKQVPAVLTSKSVIDGKTVISDTTLNSIKEPKKVFLSGYLGGYAKDEISLLPDYGANLVQMGVGISAFCYKSSGIENWIRRYNMSLGVPDATYERTTEEARNGNYSVKFTNNSEYKDNYWLALTQSVELEPNTDYTLSLWAKGSDISYFTMKPYAGRAIKRIVGADVTTMSDWTEYKINFNSLSDVNAKVYISTGGPTGTLYIDDISLVKTGDSENLLKNPGFEIDMSEERYVDADRTDLLAALEPLKEAEENNVKISLLFDVDYFVSELYDYYPGLKTTVPSSETGIGYNVTHPVAQNVLKYYIRELLSEASKYDCINDICLINEPWVKTNSDYYKTDWAAFLEKEYGNIESLNNYYNASYENFSQVPFPGTANTRTVKGYDFKLFNESIMEQWVKLMSQTAKTYAPDIPVHLKIMQYLPWADEPIARWRVGTGVNPESLAKYLDINGNDAELRFNLEDGENYSDFMRRKALHKNMWYDYMTSIKDAPVFNSEDHIIANGDMDYSEAHFKNITADQWMSAVHARSMACVWLWDRSQSANESYKWESVLFRPDLVEVIGKNSLDLNRLSNEIYTIIDTEPRVGIFYSETSRVYQLEYVNAVYQTYENCVFNGLKTGFLAESQLDKIDNFDMIIVPCAKYVPNDVLEAFKAYDGKIIILGEECFKYGVRAAQNSNEDVEAIYNKAEEVMPVTVDSSKAYLISSPDSDTLFEKIKSTADKLGLTIVEIIDNATGEKVRDVEYSYSDVNCGKIINICNYNWDEDKNVSICINGEKVTDGMTELKSGEKLSESFTIKSFEPVLVRAEEGI